MAASGATLLAVGLGVGIPLFVTAILLVVFLAVRGGAQRARVALAAEGIILDSGPVWISARFEDFRSPRFSAGISVRKSRGHLILTRARLVFLQVSRRYGIFSHADLRQFNVGVSDGKLHLHSQNPPRATGSVDFRVAVTDPEAWVRALTDAGAQPD